MRHIDFRVTSSFKKLTTEKREELLRLGARFFGRSTDQAAQTPFTRGAIELALAFGLVSCSRGPVQLDPWELGTGPGAAQELSLATQATPDDPPVPVEHQAAILRENEECAALYQEVFQQPALLGAPKLEARRELVLARGKGEPVLFVQEPQYTGEVSAGIAARRRSILKSEFPAELMEASTKLFRGLPELLRQTLLRDGYLYTDDPRTARFLTTNVKLEDLFHEDEIYLQRGAQTFRLVRGSERHFEFADGPDAGDRARLFLFDRVWLPSEVLGPAVHLDVRDFAQRLGVEGMQIERITAGHVLSHLKFDDESVPAVLDYDGQKVNLKCLSIAPERLAQVGRARDEAYRRAQVLRALRDEIVTQVREGLPFDEPKTESGQQDGELRQRFEQAYFTGQASYKFNGDRYQVYSEQGLALVPQVCIDFVTETLERASGMRWAERGQVPKKYIGALNFDELLDGHRRQELAIRAFARENSERLELHDFSQSDWVRYEHIDEFFEMIAREKRNIRPGDIMVIRGRAAWDYYHEIHTHTFYVYESDPITGMPTLLAGNSGKPRIVTWDDEMLRAPKRSIRHRIRPNMDWLYDHVVLRTPVRGERWAAPLSAVAP